MFGRYVVAVLLFMFLVRVGAVYSGADDAEYQLWLKQDTALRQAAGREVKVGDFRLKLPVGWTVVASDGLTTDLVYIGPRATGSTNGVVVNLSAVRACSGAAEFWPSDFSGWKSFPLPGGLWGVRAVVPGVAAGRSRLLARVPLSNATLDLTADYAADNDAWNGTVAELLRSLRYVGNGVPLAPPGTGDERTRSVSRMPGVVVSPDALAGSPLHPFVLKTRQAIDVGGDPARDNYVEILDTGADALLAKVYLIRAARKSIKIQTFIWGDDEVGRLMLYELIQAAKRGVKVEVIIDHIASFRNLELAAAVCTASKNLSFRHYRPSCKRMKPNHLQETLDLLIPNHTNQRMHNKVFIVDDVALITGGRNIDNSYYAQNSTINFRDRDVLMIGPMTSYAVSSFRDYWNFKKCVNTARLKDVKKVIRKGKFKRLESRDDFRLHNYFGWLEEQLNDEAVIKKKLVAPLREVKFALFLADPPGKTSRRYTAYRRGTIARQLEAVMRTARSSLIIQTPYLVLDGGMLKIFRKLRQQNPGIELMASSNSFGATDNPMAYAANFKMRPAYIKAGINVYEFRQLPGELSYQLPNYDVLLRRNEAQRGTATMHQTDKPFMCIHAKALVVNDVLAFVGSYNFDPRSISLNTEVGLLVEDAAFAARVREAIERDVEPQNSWVVAKRKHPRAMREIERNLPPDTSRAHVDMWPFRNTSGYELRPGARPVPPSVPGFYSNYKDIGAFPGAKDSGMAMKKVFTCISGVLSWLTVPLL